MRTGSNRTLAFDSGRATGWALSDGARLVDCGLVKVQDDRHIAAPRLYACRVVIEYPIDRNQVDPNDLIKLGSRCGRLQERYLERGNRVDFVYPSTWKGSVSKEICERRTKAELTDRERAIVDSSLSLIAPGLQNNVWDAVGILLWSVGRGFKK